MELLLDRRSRKIEPTTAVLAISAQTLHKTGKTVLLFDEYGDEIKLTLEVLKPVLGISPGNRETERIIDIILAKHGRSPVIAMRVLDICIQTDEQHAGLYILKQFDNELEATEETLQHGSDSCSRDFWLQMLFSRCSDVTITPNIAQQVARRCDVKTVSLLLSRWGHKVAVTKPILKAAASNESCSRKVLPIFLERCPEDLGLLQAWLIWSSMWVAVKRGLIEKLLGAGNWLLETVPFLEVLMIFTFLCVICMLLLIDPVFDWIHNSENHPRRVWERLRTRLFGKGINEQTGTSNFGQRTQSREVAP